MDWTKFITDYLTFTRRDRIALISLIIIISGVYLIPKALPHKKKDISASDSTAIVSFIHERSGENDTKYKERKYPKQDLYHSPGASRQKAELFVFDPNTLSLSGWERLGLREKTIHTISNYLAKGGKFKKAEDLKKIYGLFPDEYERLAPYIKIENLTRESAVAKRESSNSFPIPTSPLISDEATQREKKFINAKIIDINAADTSAFISLPGIGSKLANRMINFRNKLGGFYSVEQVGETFGLPDSTFQKIKKYLKLQNTQVRKININTATLEELKSHPYIRFTIANAIFTYRKEHGPFGSVEQIKNVMAVTDENYKKITPYLIID